MTGKLLASLCKQKTYERNTKTVSKLTQNTESVSNNFTLPNVCPNMGIIPQGGVPRPYRASRAMRAIRAVRAVACRASIHPLVRHFAVQSRASHSH